MTRRLVCSRNAIIVAFGSMLLVFGRESPNRYSFDDRVVTRSIFAVRSVANSGLRTVLIEDHRFPIVLVKLIIQRAGPGVVGYSPGVSRVAIELLLSSDIAGTSLAKLLDERGARVKLGEDVSSNSAFVEVLCHREDVSDIVPLLLTTLRHCIVDQAGVDRISWNVARSIAAQRMFPPYIAEYSLFVRLGLRQEIVEPMNGISVDEVRRWMNERYVEENVVLGVIGDIDKKMLVKLTGKGHHLHSRAHSSWSVTKHIRRSMSSNVVKINVAQSSRMHISIGMKSIGRGSRDYIPLVLWNAILGSPSKSRLRSALRDKTGLAYSISADLIPVKAESSWTISTSVDVKNVAEVFGLIMHEIEAMRSGNVNESELEDSKRRLTDEFVLSLEVPNHRLGYALDTELYGINDAYWRSYRRRIVDTSLKEVIAAGRQHIDCMCLQVILVGKTEELEKVQGVVSNILEGCRGRSMRH